jgi:hypothetical protein
MIAIFALDERLKRICLQKKFPKIGQSGARSAEFVTKICRTWTKQAMHCNYFAGGKIGVNEMLTRAMKHCYNCETFSEHEQDSKG